ncbi:hypothetical protein FHS55_002152 [Angulomicrobium tetraedrale]|uniref:Uncharacterized protein n=1 Tax=Ancylobacter tetraedralis TaxID=217068 RepID=A0A839Z9Z1_9HYPH|nr:hypothetical protein [Ancylobacter tetraedralis]MBB3771553.1 hypothetical protein [Ancylobacter tetraedralis]
MPDWLNLPNITAVLTTIVGSATALLLFIQDRRQRNGELPDVECTIAPRPRGEDWFPVVISVRNFGPRTAHVKEFRLEKPRSGRIFSAYADNFGDQTDPKVLPVGSDVSAAGSTTGPLLQSGVAFASGSAVRTDTQSWRFAIDPGASSGGMGARVAVLISVIIEERSRVLRSRRIAIHRIIRL